MAFDDRPGSPSQAPPTLGIGRPPDTIVARTPQQTRANDTFPLAATSMVVDDFAVRPSQSPGQVLDWTGFIDPTRTIAPPPRHFPGREDDLPEPAPEDEIPTKGWNVIAQHENAMRATKLRDMSATSVPMMRKTLDPTFDPAAAPPYISIASAPKSIYSSTPVGLTHVGPEKTDPRLTSLVEENATLRQNLQLEKASNQEFISRKELERENVARYVRTLEDKVANLEMQVTRSQVQEEHQRLQQSQTEVRMEKTAEVIQALREQLVLSEKRATDFQTQTNELRKQLTDAEKREQRYREEADLERKNADKREQQLKESSERRERQLKENFEQHREQLRSSQDQREKAMKESSIGERDKMSQTLREERENSRGLMSELKHLREATGAMQADVKRAEEQLERERSRTQELEAEKAMEQGEYKAKLQDAIATLSDLQKEYRLACELNNDLRKTATSAHEDNEVLLKRLQERTDQLLDHQSHGASDVRVQELQRQVENLRSENGSLIQLVESLQTNHQQQLHHHMQQEQQWKAQAQAQAQAPLGFQVAGDASAAAPSFSGVPIGDISNRFAHSQSGSDSAAGDSFPRVLPAKSPPTSFAQPARPPPRLLGAADAAAADPRGLASRPGGPVGDFGGMSGPLPPPDLEPLRAMPQGGAPVQRALPPGMGQGAPGEGVVSYGGPDWLGDDGMPGVGAPPSTSGSALTVEKLEGWGGGDGPADAAAPPTIIPVTQGQGIMQQLLSSLTKAPPGGVAGHSLGGSGSSYGTGPGPILGAGGLAAGGGGGMGQGYGGGAGGRQVGGRERELALMEKSAQEVMQAGYDPDSVIGV